MKNIHFFDNNIYNIFQVFQLYNEIEYFTRINEIYSDTDNNVVYIIDELSKKFPKNAPLDREFYSWLQQSRKKSRYVYLITQEYLNVPQWLRGVANLVYITHKVRFFNYFTIIQN